MNLDSVSRKLADLLQAQFPLTRHPYADIGSDMGISEQEVIALIGQLKAEGIIRQIGPVLDARNLGYQTTLVAMRVAENQMDRAAQVIGDHPGISHGYERDHYFNFWFTLAVPAAGETETELSALTEMIKAETCFALPSVRLFKLRALFSMGKDGQNEDTDSHPTGLGEQKAELSAADRMVINALQQDLPLVPQPFAPMSVRAGMNEDKFLSLCQSLITRGIMRRFGAAVNHRKAGFTANAMTCWAAPPDKVEAAGQKLAQERQVSHCYERKTNPLWKYNLFAMIHGHTVAACQEIADRVSSETGLTDCIMLLSTREFKKTRIKYPV